MADCGQHTENLRETQPEIKTLKAAYEAALAAWKAGKLDDVGLVVRLRSAWFLAESRRPCPCSTCRYRCCDGSRP